MSCKSDTATTAKTLAEAKRQAKAIKMMEPQFIFSSLDETCMELLDPDRVNLLIEDTIDVGFINTKPFIPLSPRGPPQSNDLAGDVNFKVEVTSTDAHKKKFLYSHMLGRIYVDMNCNFSVLFNWDSTLYCDMYVRATVVFAEVEQSEKRVERCVQHFHECSGLAKPVAMNVLHSTREIGTQGVYYCGDSETADSWFSVLVHFHKTSPEACSHAYKFTCKSSCASGINRRAIAIIFTLEDNEGRIFGRQKVGVKVCSCLRRDMLKDEESEGVYKTGKKRIPSNQIPQTKTKKIKLETLETDPNMVMLPKVAVEVNAMRSGLRTMIDMMTTAGEHNRDVVEKYATSITELQKVLNSLGPAQTPQ